MNHCIYTGVYLVIVAPHKKEKKIKKFCKRHSLLAHAQEAVFCSLCGGHLDSKPVIITKKKTLTDLIPKGILEHNEDGNPIFIYDIFEEIYPVNFLDSDYTFIVIPYNKNDNYCNHTNFGAFPITTEIIKISINNFLKKYLKYLQILEKNIGKSMESIRVEYGTLIYQIEEDDD